MGEHKVSVAAGSRLAGLLGGGSVLSVPTHHHQGIDQLGAGLVPVAWAEDGVIEAVELDGAGCPGHQFTVAVQWHPEAGDDPALFRALVRVAAPLAEHRQRR